MLSTLINRLAGAVPDRNGVPTDDQYEQAVRDAVNDYSRRHPLRRTWVLHVIEGTATYELPADFLKLIILASLSSPDNQLINSPAGLIPISANWSERYTIAGKKITFFPVPGYSMARLMDYSALHLATGEAGTEEYEDMAIDDEDIVLLKAQSIALMLQANAAAKLAWQYQIGDERVSMEKLSTELRAQANALGDQYLSAIAQRTGALGMRG